MAMRPKRRLKTWSRKRPIEHTGFYPYLQLYLEGMTIQGLSDTTLYGHEGHIRQFAVWCETRSLDKPNDITKPILERYQKHLYYLRKADGKPLTFHAQRNQLTALKSFFKWLTQKNHLLYNPASELTMPKLPHRLPRTILSRESIEDVLNRPDVTSEEGLRDRCILELLYSTGIRRKELTNLKLYDIDLRRGIVMVRAGKGNKDRYLPLSERMQAWLEKYLADGRDAYTNALDADSLFLSDFGEPFNGTELGRLVKGYLIDAGLDVAGSCHLFRHAMATHMLDNGADIRFIQAMLGHGKLTSTEIYTRVSVETLRAVHAATHPSMRQRDE